jgi:CO/xanthine dehydrogenase Mo-binding subunit
LYEQVRADERGIRSRDWTTYPVLRFDGVPKVQVIVVDQAGHPPLGAGEAATPPVSAALANAVDDAVGIRLRQLPFTPDRTRQRLLDMSDEELERVLVT